MLKIYLFAVDNCCDFINFLLKKQQDCIFVSEPKQANIIYVASSQPDAAYGFRERFRRAGKTIKKIEKTGKGYIIISDWQWRD